MAAPKLEVILGAKDELGRVLEQTKGRLESMSKGLMVAGGIMTGFGIATVGALGLMVKAAAEEEAGINRLRVAMRNVGLDYDANRESLEDIIAVTQRKTAVADDEQRASLASLVLMTGDLNKALDLNALAMDLAAGTGRDLSSATQLLSYAMAGNWGMVGRLIPAIKEAKNEEERWMMLRRLFAGQAEEYGATMEGQFKALSASIGDLKESLGAVLLPMVKDITEAVQKFVGWLEDLDPALKEIGVKAALAAGAFSLIVGPALILVSQLPKLAAGFHAVAGGILAVRAAGVVGLGTALGVMAGVLGIVAGAFIYMKKAGEATAHTMEELAELYPQMHDALLECGSAAKSSADSFSDWLAELYEATGGTERVAELTAAYIAKLKGLTGATDAGTIATEEGADAWLRYANNLVGAAWAATAFDLDKVLRQMAQAISGAGEAGNTFAALLQRMGEELLTGEQLAIFEDLRMKLRAAGIAAGIAESELARFGLGLTGLEGGVDAIGEGIVAWQTEIDKFNRRLLYTQYLEDLIVLGHEEALKKIVGAATAQMQLNRLFGWLDKQVAGVVAGLGYTAEEIAAILGGMPYAVPSPVEHVSMPYEVPSPVEYIRPRTREEEYAYALSTFPRDWWNEMMSGSQAPPEQTVILEVDGEKMAEVVMSAGGRAVQNRSRIE